MSDTSDPGTGGWDSSACIGGPACPPRCPRFVDSEGSRWTLRQADPEDADRLTAMYADFGAADRAQGIPPAVDHRRQSWIEMLLEEGHNIVAEGADRIVGHVVYTPVDDAQPELAVFVHPDFHDRGIGTELCKQVAAAAAAAGCEALELHVEPTNRAAISVYQRIGFEEVPADHGLRMVLPLDDGIVSAVSAPPADRPVEGAPSGRVADD
ncbi:MAG: GNAT family N-acetyltransferase [Halohasta sp.]